MRFGWGHSQTISTKKMTSFLKEIKFIEYNIMKIMELSISQISDLIRTMKHIILNLYYM